MLSRQFRKSFGFRLFRLFSGMVLLLALIFTGAVIYYQTRQLSNDLIKEGRIISTLLAGNLKTWIFAESPEKISEALKEVIAYPHIDSISVFNARSELLSQEHKGAHNGDLEFPAAATLTYSREENSVFHVKEGAQAFYVTSPVTMVSSRFEDEILYFDRPAEKVEVTIGYIRIGISKESLKKEAEHIVVKVAAAVFLGLLAGLVILLIAVRRVTNPISELTEYVRQFGSGEAIGQITTEGRDEISRLTEAFNIMALNLGKREAEKELLEEKLRKARTMEAVGTLARGVAHDFNNILSTIQGSLYLIEKRYDDIELMRYTGEIQQSVAKARDLIGGLLTFSRSKAVVLHPLDLNGVIETLCPLLGNMLGSGIGLRCDLCTSPLTVLGDTLQLEQVLMNLTSNARDAMAHGGTLTITTTVEVHGQSGAAAVPLSPGRYARLSVRDTGEGMDEATRQKIFEPFFTTKERGKGTGLGLAIVYGIIEQHQGFIDLDTGHGTGTTFHIWIPLWQVSPEGNAITTEGEQP